MERLMLLDGYGLVYRGYFALPPLTTSKGELVNGVFGFASIVLRGLQDLQPDYLAVSFDLPGPTFRHEQYAEYKATRVRMPDDLRDQFPKVREVVKALRIPVYEMAGFEADDVIGTITQQLDTRDDLETTIVTVDLDMLQLVTPARPADDDAIRRREHGHLRRRPDRRAVRPAARPDDRLQGAQGRPDRQHPGRARGRGEDRRQAHPRVRRRSTRSCRGSTRSPRPSSATSCASTSTRSGWASELSTIVRDLPIEIDLEAARLGDYDRDTVVRLFREYEFRTLIERLPPMAGESAEQRIGEPAHRGPERLRARGARRRPARGLGTRAAPTRAARGRRAPAAARLRRRDRTAAAAGDGRARDGHGRPSTPTGPRVRARRRTCRPRWPRRSSTPAGSRSAAPTGSPTSSRGSRRSPRSASSLLLDDPAAAPRDAAGPRRRRCRTAGWSPPRAPRPRTPCAAC